MAKIRLLITNYIENSLISELLKRDYQIATLNTRTNGRPTFSPNLDKFDLVYFAKFYPPLWDDLSILSHRTKTPVIYSFHSPSIIFHPYRMKNYVVNAISLTKLLFMRVSGNIAAFHTLNTSEYNMLKSFGFRCYYIPLGVDTRLFCQGLKSNRFTVVFVGPKYVKGVDMLIRLVPRVLRNAPDIKFVLTGRGFLKKYYISLKSVFKKNIEVYEWLMQREFAKLLSSSHVLLFPSRYESFGLVVLEALSSGLPVFCFDIPGAPRDIVGNYGGGVVTHPFNIDELADNIVRTYEMWKNSPDEFKRLSSNCRNLALKYDWRNVSNVFDDVFQSILYGKD